MDKLKYVKLENPDGSYSDSIPLSVSAEHVDIASAGGVSNLANYISANDTNIGNLQTTTLSLNNRVDSLASGSPLVASSTAEMVDTTRTYVNTSDGYWYYYNGSSWVQGGVYQSTSDSKKIDDERTGSLKSEYYLIYGGLSVSGGVLIETPSIKKVCTPEISCRTIKNFIFKQNTNFASLGVFGKNGDGTWTTINSTTGWGVKYINDLFIFYIKDSAIESFRICYWWRADHNADIAPEEKNACSFIPYEEKITSLQGQMLVNSFTSCQYGIEYGGVHESGAPSTWNNIRLRTQAISLSPTRYLYVKILDSDIGFANIAGGPDLDRDHTWSLINAIWLDDEHTICTFDDEIKYVCFSFVHKSEREKAFTEEERVKIIVQPYFQEVETKPWWKGKKYCALGDSITYGFIPRNYTGYPGQLDSYAKLTAEKLGMTFENYGISGSTLAYHENRQPMCVRYTNMPDDADLITVMGGTNDIRNGIELGTMSDRTNTTYYGALHVLLGGLYKKYIIDQGTTVGKNKKIVVLTPIKLLQTSGGTEGGTGTLKDMSAWVNAVKEVAAYYSFPVLDFYNLSGINPHLNETIHGTESGYTGWYNPYITDGTHPTQEGAEMMADVLVGFLKTLK